MNKIIKILTDKYKEYSWEIHILFKSGFNAWKKYRINKSKGFPKYFYTGVHPDIEEYWELVSEEFDAILKGEI